MYDNGLGLVPTHGDHMISRDKSRRRETDEVTNLQRESVMLRRILYTTPDHIYVYDRRGRYRFASRAGANALGLRAGGMVGKTWRELQMPAEVMEPFEQQVREVFDSIASISGETIYPTPGGERYFEYTLNPIEESGRVDLVMATMRDVTERKRTELELRQSRAELEQRVVRQEEGLTSALAAVQREGSARQTTLARLVGANRQLRMVGELNHLLPRADNEDQLLRGACRLVVERGGYRMAWIGQVRRDERRSIKPLVHVGFDHGFLEASRFSWAEDRWGASDTGTAARLGRPTACADIMKDVDYEPWREEAVKRGYASSMALPIMSNERVHSVLTIFAERADAFDDREVGHLQELVKNLAYGIEAQRTRAEHDHAEEALRQNRARYRAMVMGQVDAVCRWLPDTTLSFVNESFCKFYGEELNNLLGKKWLSLFTSMDRDQIAVHFNSLVEHPRVVRYEYLLTGAGGAKRWQEWVDFPITDGRGEVVEFQSVGRDITERKKTEARLRDSEAKLRAQTRQLEQKNMALREILTQIEQEKLEIKRQVSANVEAVVMPVLERMKDGADQRQQLNVDLLELNLKDLSSKFGVQIKQEVVSLSPREVEICTMIRHGMGSKEISSRLHISLRTVETHRNTIRKKLGVSGKKVNLATYLRNLG